MPVGDLIRANAVNSALAQRAFLRFNDAAVTHAEYYAECIRWANLFRNVRDRGPGVASPFHIGVLLDNIPDYFYALGGAALAGGVVVGINNTKRGAFLARDIAYTDCLILVTEERYLPMLAPVAGETRVEPQRIFVSRRWDEDAATAPPSAHAFRDLQTALTDLGSGPDPQVPVTDSDPFVLVFTSGTVTAPKAVVCSHGRMVETGRNIAANRYEMTADDVAYIAMPLFHANALMCGFLPALSCGAGVAMIRKFSKSRWLGDIRRYGATVFNYTGKPLAYILATPRQPDDHLNPLRICYGNEGSHRVVAEFEERFACRVVDVFGSSEGGLGVTREPGDPPRSIGFPAPGVIVVDGSGTERPPARFDETGRLQNPEEAIGEIVNTQGLAWFEGYYKNPEATEQRTRHGWYWSGDLGYRDEQGYLYFAGRDVEWLRVDGENFVGRPIEEILQRDPDVILAAVYGVPDVDGGDRVMAALILRDGAEFSSDHFRAFIEAQPDLSPKWMPTFIRVAGELPQTATSKILKNELRRQKFRPDLCPDPVYWRTRTGEPYRRFTADDFARIRAAFESAGKLALLDV